jgi:hypothetical protein
VVFLIFGRDTAGFVEVHNFLRTGGVVFSLWNRYCCLCRSTLIVGTGGVVCNLRNRYCGLCRGLLIGGTGGGSFIFGLDTAGCVEV